MNTCKHRVFFIFLLLFLLFQFFNCSERDRHNPFDFSGKRESPVQLNLIYQQNSVKLTWTVQNISDYSGFKIYKSTGETDNFTELARLPANIFEHVDNSVTNYKWHSYYVTVVSPAGESMGSNVEKTYPGPNQVWVLSQYGFVMSKLSYDLLHNLKHYELQFPPVEWNPVLTDSTVWLSFGVYSRLAKFNLSMGHEEYFITEKVRRPVDVAFSQENNTLYTLDNEANKIFQFTNRVAGQEITLPEDFYIKMEYDRQNKKLYILSHDAFTEVNVQNNFQTNVLDFPGDYQGLDLQYHNNLLDVLAASESLDRSLILSRQANSAQWDSLYTAGFFYRIARNHATQTFYLAQVSGSQNNSVVKLSSEGNRLSELKNFNLIEQIVVNPQDNTFIVVDRCNDRLFLYREDGTRISQRDNYYDPIRVHIE